MVCKLMLQVTFLEYHVEELRWKPFDRGDIINSPDTVLKGHSCDR